MPLLHIFYIIVFIIMDDNRVMNDPNKNAMMSHIRILRNANGKTGGRAYIQPCRDAFGNYPKCVKHVDSKGDMVLSDAEKNDPGRDYFIRENDVIIIEDGTTFDLSNPYDKSRWEAIENCKLIAPSRWAKDASGKYLIDGTSDMKTRDPRYGVASFYVEIPGMEAAKKVKKKKLIHAACAYIWDDPLGSEGRMQKARVLGKRMLGAADADVLDFLLQVAEKDPEKIIRLYTSDDMTTRIMFLDAKDRKVIIHKDKLYIYGENTILGATDESVITYLLNPKNKRIVEMIRMDTYPEMYVKKDTPDEDIDTGNEPKTYSRPLRKSGYKAHEKRQTENTGSDSSKTPEAPAAEEEMHPGVKITRVTSKGK